MPNVHDLTIWKEKKTIEVVPYKKKHNPSSKNNLLKMDYTQNRRLNNWKSQTMPFYSTI